MLFLTACQFGLTPNRGGPDRPRDPGTRYDGCEAPNGARASGTWDDPVSAGELPFADHLGDTTDGDAAADTYDCGPMDRSGPEVVYTLKLSEEKTNLRAEVVGGQGVAVTVQLLGPDATNDGGAVTGCVAVDQDGVLAVDRLAAGEYTVVVDTLVPGTGEARPGAYSLVVRTETNFEWENVELAEGLRWKHRRDSVEGTVNQDWNALIVELDKREARALPNMGCSTVPEKGEAEGAIAGVNGGFGDEACKSLDLVRDDGVTFSKNAYADSQRIVVWEDGGAATMEWLARDLDYTRAANAFAGYPSLVTAGQGLLEPTGTDELYTTRQARTAVGITDVGDLILFVADGGTTGADGLTLDELAAAMLDLGAVHAFNLDGGGATTMYVPGCTATGVANHPLDGGGTSREGARGVPDGVYVF
ncbi:MAG: phosphodiester glycosidase family protein [Myxococcota bacterium]